jgi:putative ABC transport system permease protein
MPYLLKLILANTLRHKLRSSLTIVGLLVAILAFGLLQTVVGAWYAGVDAASSSRLITRNAISLIFSMPETYFDKIRRVKGVSAVSYANWFGGIYQEPKNFFPKFAIDPGSYFALYPEYVIKPQELAAFKRERKAAVIGRKLAQEYGFKLGDIIPIKGDIYPGNWEFVVRAIYDGKDAKVDTSQMLFHWSYLNETIRRNVPRRSNQVGIFLVQLQNPDDAASVSLAIDATFKNSLAETLSETEKAFQLGFVKQTETIVIAIRIVSFVVIFIIMAVMANTMAMTARERIAEYATLKALGFGPGFVALLIFGESLAIGVIGAGLGIAASFPVAVWFAAKVGTLFPIFEISRETLLLQFAAGLVVASVAAMLPARRAAAVKIVDGLRHVG